MAHKGPHIMATDKMRDRCGTCGTWRRVHKKCNLVGCKHKEVDVGMCKCTLKGIR